MSGFMSWNFWLDASMCVISKYIQNAQNKASMRPIVTRNPIL